jgi:hypothetical protein
MLIVGVMPTPPVIRQKPDTERLRSPDGTRHRAVVTEFRPDDPFDPDGAVEPDGSASTEQVEYSEATHSALTPIGQIESYGNFTRGLGARRVKMAIGVLGLAMIALIAVSEL